MTYFIRWVKCLLICAPAFVCQVVHAQDQKPSISAEVTPSELSLNASATLTVTVDCPTSTQEQTLEVFPPPGFTVSPKTYSLGSSAGHKTRQFEVQGPRTYVASASWKFVVLLSDKNGELASLSQPFIYRSGISLIPYFVLGLLGIGTGYLARLVVDSLNSLPKPVLPAAAAAPAGGGIPNLGWFTEFMKENYYLMDFGVTVVLGFLALTALVKDNHPPESAMYWYSALGLGFGIGLLTNSDLVTRLRTK
jgi:hypothetical protein